MADDIARLGDVAATWIAALRASPVAWLDAAQLRTAGTSRRGRKRSLAATALQVFYGILAAASDSTPTASVRCQVYDLAAELVPELRRPVIRRGRTAQRYATALADKAEWVRQQIKGAPPLGAQCLLALEAVGALRKTDAAVHDARAWPGAPGERFEGASAALAWFTRRDMASTLPDPDGAIGFLVADLLYGPWAARFGEVDLPPRDEAIAAFLAAWAHGERLMI